jgi:oligopeptide/dipeptide ABC transporter ATP-binding protein
MAVLLKVDNLKTQFRTDYGLVKAVDNVSFYIEDKEIVGFVGESGCGKTVTQMSVMQLIPKPPGEITDGHVIFEGKDLLKYGADSEEMRAVRGRKIAMIYQEPMTSLNPVLTICRQITETLEIHLHMDKKAARERTIELLRMVGIPSAESRLDDYPHQFSGGMRQRVMVAMALACNPGLLIADEPTTALDVTTQAQLLELMSDLVARLNTSIILVTHNLGVVARYAKRLYVMYAGRIVESGTCKQLFGQPRHPYTIGLLKCLPRLDEARADTLATISGAPPNLMKMRGTCAFLPRCGNAVEKCKTEIWPDLRDVGENHFVSCYVDIGEGKSERKG